MRGEFLLQHTGSSLMFILSKGRRVTLECFSCIYLFPRKKILIPDCFYLLLINVSDAETYIVPPRLVTGG